MAGYLESQVGRYNRFMQKLHQIKTTIRPVVVPEIGHTLSLFHGAENRYLEGWDRFGWVQTFAALAAAVNQLRLRNPSGSNVVAVLEKVQMVFSSADTGRLSHGPTAADLAGVITNNSMRWDPRGRVQSALILSNAQAASNPVGVLKATIGGPAFAASDVVSTDVQEFPLLPGDAIHMENNTVNLPSQITFWWRERGLEESEFK